jgi:DNA adenine methylase
MPEHRVYIEPFGGAASVLLRKQRAPVEIYNDIDSEIVNLFRVARDRGQELKRALELTPFSREEFNLSWDFSEDSLEQARRTVIRSCLGRDSASATMARKSSFRVYSGPKRAPTTSDWDSYPQALDAIIERLRRVAIENTEASKVMLAHDFVDTLHYVDPPYIAAKRDRGLDYRYELSDEQHEELIKLLLSLNGMVLLSGYDSELYNDMLTGWQKVTADFVAQSGEFRTEVLWISPSAQDAAQRQIPLYGI